MSHISLFLFDSWSFGCLVLTNSVPSLVTLLDSYVHQSCDVSFFPSLLFYSFSDPVKNSWQIKSPGSAEHGRPMGSVSLFAML